MNKPDADYRLQWQPPPRPEWVRRINDEGYCMNIGDTVPLDEKSLLESAMRSTGLSDFGANEWCEPFRFFIKGPVKAAMTGPLCYDHAITASLMEMVEVYVPQ
jgi:hypothetical protein